MRSRSILAAISLFSICAVVHATERHDPPKRPKNSHATPPAVTVGASSAAHGDARASSDSASTADAAASSTQEQLANSASGGNSFSTSSDVLALELPGHAGATAVDECHVSRGSLGALGIGSGGRVKFDEECVAHVRCLETAAVLERLGRADAAARVVVHCAGVQLPADLLGTPPQPAGPDPVYVTREEFERAWSELVAK